MRVFFFFNDTATTEIYTLSLHDALPIYELADRGEAGPDPSVVGDPVPVERDVEVRADQHPPPPEVAEVVDRDRKSTRLNSSHANISYAVFCLKKNKLHKHLHPTSSHLAL